MLLATSVEAAVPCSASVVLNHAKLNRVSNRTLATRRFLEIPHLLSYRDDAMMSKPSDGVGRRDVWRLSQ